MAGLGKKYSEERINKSKENRGYVEGWNKGKKGLQIAWNKGLTKDDPRVRKYTENNKHREFLKIYTLILPDNSEIIFNGRNKLESYIKEINSTFNFKSRVNVDNLIKNKFEKNFSLFIQ